MAAKSKILTPTSKNGYPETIDQRLFQIRFTMEDIKLDGIAVTHVPNIRYLTNFSGSAATMFVLKDEIHFVTDDRYAEAVADELYPLPNLQIHISRAPFEYAKKSKILAKVKNLGFEADRMPYSEAVEIRNVIRPVKFKPAPNEIERFTVRKAPEETAYIKEACEMAETLFQKMLKVIKVGMTEKDVANELIYNARKLGSEGEPFDVIVTSGPRTSLVHASPSSRKIKKGDLVLLDYGCKVHGFCSDITRVLSLGKPSKEMQAVYKTVYEAKNLAMANARSHMKGDTLDGFARKYIEKAGYGEFFQHSSGHGIGISVHESPIITHRLNNQIIPEDSVLSIEPGVYFPGKFGIRLEDQVLVSKMSTTALSNAPKEIPVI